MKDNWNELFDNLNEEDILRNLPENLPEMEDELAAKRIENKVMQELKIDIGLQKKQSKKRFIVAAACCILAVGTFGYKPIMAAFQRLFHDLPGVGVFINEEDKEIYEVQIDNPVMEKDGVRAELKNFYCADNQIFGKIVITGKDLRYWGGNTEIDYSDPSGGLDELEEKFFPTWYYSDIEREMITGSRGRTSEDDGSVIEFRMECEEYLRLEQGFDTYQIHIAGFDERFTLKIVDSKIVETPEEIGYSQTKNGTTITARAAVENDKINLEYYIIPAEEVKLYFQYPAKRYFSMMPYQYDIDNYVKVFNVKGEELIITEPISMKSGISGTLWGTEEDFPLTFHYPPLTGTNMERFTVNLKIPDDGRIVTNDLPALEFKYGTVEILSVERRNGEESNNHPDDPEAFPATFVDLIYRITPKDGLRQMYDVDLEIENAEFRGSSGLDTGEDFYIKGREICLHGHEVNEMTVTFEFPLYWIQGDYDIVIEKPMAKE